MNRRTTNPSSGLEIPPILTMEISTLESSTPKNLYISTPLCLIPCCCKLLPGRINSYSWICLSQTLDPLIDKSFFLMRLTAFCNSLIRRRQEAMKRQREKANRRSHSCLYSNTNYVPPKTLCTRTSAHSFWEPAPSGF